MKKIKINEYLYGLLSIVIVCLFIGSLLTGISAIIFGEAPTKVSGVRKYHFDDIINIFIFSGLNLICLYFYLKYVEPEIKKVESITNKLIQFSKCPKRKETFTYINLQKGKCPNCKEIDTIEIEEYYKKYPNEIDE